MELIFEYLVHLIGTSLSDDKFVAFSQRWGELRKLKIDKRSELISFDSIGLDLIVQNGVIYAAYIKKELYKHDLPNSILWKDDSATVMQKMGVPPKTSKTVPGTSGEPVSKSINFEYAGIEVNFTFDLNGHELELVSFYCQLGEAQEVEKVPLDKLSEATQRVIDFAKQEALNAGHDYVGSEHLLAGLLKDDESVSAAVLRSYNIDLVRLRDESDRICGRGKKPCLSQGSVFTPGAAITLARALEEATQRGATLIEPTDILVGMIEEGTGVGWRAMVNLGADPDLIANEVRRINEELS